ncbi:creatininase [Candidatus Acidianus copahuensis]|uniref:Creatininase n=2 Tax=Candidatus Acidianus copahuensis TaxID=1160895 RepID=A0A031LR99_9CREN|nr:creatininase family protein [Candidatus Acidianus copahuensis]EZQ10351.1 creatininase [Candidatus Acidianus copahuensis]
MEILKVTREEVPGKVGIIPIGSVEQHGPHLPMGTDSLIAEWVARQVERRNEKEVLLFPTIYYGCSLEHNGFPYVGISYVTMINYLVDLLNATKDSGIKSIIIINGHGGNRSVLDIVARQINFTSSSFKVYVFNINSDEELGLPGPDLHAGSVETSRIKAIDKDLVKDEKIDEIKDFSYKEGVFSTLTVKEANQYGVIGNGIVVDAEKGIMSLIEVVNKVEELLKKIIS